MRFSSLSARGPEAVSGEALLKTSCKRRKRGAQRYADVANLNDIEASFPSLISTDKYLALTDQLAQLNLREPRSLADRTKRIHEYSVILGVYRLFHGRRLPDKGRHGIVAF